MCRDQVEANLLGWCERDSQQQQYQLTIDEMSHHHYSTTFVGREAEFVGGDCAGGVGEDCAESDDAGVDKFGLVATLLLRIEEAM